MSKLLFDTYSVTALERMKSVDLERYAVHGKGTVANLCDAMIYAKSQLAAKERECEELKRRVRELTIAGDAMYAYGDFTRSTFNVDSEWSRIITKESPP